MGRGTPSTIAQDRLFEPLVSCKVAIREDRTEGSRTTKLGTDEQKSYTEAYLLG